MGGSTVADYHKLVRDRIPEIIAEAGKQYRTSQAGGADYVAALKRKLVEEAEELACSTDTAGELVDVLEVIDALLVTLELDWDTLRRLQADKRSRRGSFQQGIVLEWVED